MILDRTVFQAKYGKADELVNLMKKASKEWGDAFGKRSRILTDLSGPFFTVVIEAEFESLADWERSRAAAFADPRFAEFFSGTTPLIESGRQELYTIEM